MKKIITRVLALCLAVMMLMTCASAAYNARQINQALGELKKEGKIAELEKQYFGEEISPLLDQK